MRRQREAIEIIFPFGGIQALLIMIFIFCLVFIVDTALIECSRSSTCGRFIFDEKVWGPPPVEDLVYCEKDFPDDIMRETRNALTCLAYIYFGFVIFIFGLSDFYTKKIQPAKFINSYQSNIVKQPFKSVFYGISFMYVGFSGFVYHAYGSEITEMHEIFAIIIHLFIIISFSFTMFFHVDSPKSFKVQIFGIAFTMIGMVTFGILTFSKNISSDLGLYIIVVQSVLILILNVAAIQYRKRTETPMTSFSTRSFIASLAFLVFSFIFQEEYIPLNCNEEEFFQYHALYHVINSAASFTLYLYFRGDGKVPEDSPHKI